MVVQNNSNKNSKVDSKVIVGLVLTVIGVIVLCINILVGIGVGSVLGKLVDGMQETTQEYNDFVENANKTIGVISDVEDGVTYYEFTDSNNELVQNSISFTTSSYSKGTQVTVYYDEEDSEKCICDELFRMSTKGISLGSKIVPLILICVGLVFSLALIIPGIVLMNKGRKTGITVSSEEFENGLNMQSFDYTDNNSASIVNNSEENHANDYSGIDKNLF